MPERPNATDDLPCPEPGCQGTLELRESKHGPFYGCTRFPECQATHGAHPDGAPLGVPGDTATKRARQAAHAAFDRLWRRAPDVYELPQDEVERGKAISKLQRIGRRRAYRWLAERLRMTLEECHIGAMDEFTCQLVERVCRGVGPADIRAWYKARQVQAWRTGQWPDGTPYTGRPLTVDEARKWG